MKLKHKYKPKVWKDLMLPKGDGPRRVIEKLFVEKELASDGLLLYDTFSDGGTGKSTLVDLFASTFEGPIIKLDSSGNKASELDDLRKELVLFSGKHGFEETKVLVICHEISASPVSYINGLRDIMDDHSFHTLFLFTDNNYAKLSTSCPQMFKNQRCTSLDYDTVPPEEIKEACYRILEAEYKETTFKNSLAENKKIIDKLVLVNKTSIRGVITGMENNCI